MIKENTFISNISSVSLNKKAKNQEGKEILYGEEEILINGNYFVWLDIIANDADISLNVSVVDAKRNKQFTLVGETVIPSGAMLSLFSYKLITNKKIILRVSGPATYYYEMKEAQ